MVRDSSRRASDDEAERRAAISEIRARAAEMWGEQRAAEIEPTLERTALAVWRLSQLDFATDEGPAFYLSEFGGEDPDAGPRHEPRRG